MLAVFLYIFCIIGFGIEEIIREQRESDRRVRENMARISRRR